MRNCEVSQKWMVCIGRMRCMADTSLTPQPCEVVEEVTKMATETGTSGADVLQDSYGRRHNYLRISLTERCNLRCKLLPLITGCVHWHVCLYLPWWRFG